MERYIYWNATFIIIIIIIIIISFGERGYNLLHETNNKEIFTIRPIIPSYGLYWSYQHVFIVVFCQ